MVGINKYFGSHGRLRVLIFVTFTLGFFSHYFVQLKTWWAYLIIAGMFVSYYFMLTKYLLTNDKKSLNSS